MNNPDHISESLETNFWGLKYLNYLMRIRDPGWRKLESGIWDKHPGSATLVENIIHVIGEEVVEFKVKKSSASRRLMKQKYQERKPRSDNSA
jgi:hypothetical protein